MIVWQKLRSSWELLLDIRLSKYQSSATKTLVHPWDFSCSLSVAKKIFKNKKRLFFKEIEAQYDEGTTSQTTNQATNQTRNQAANHTTPKDKHVISVFRLNKKIKID